MAEEVSKIQAGINQYPDKFIRKKPTGASSSPVWQQFSQISQIINENNTKNLEMCICDNCNKVFSVM